MDKKRSFKCFLVALAAISQLTSVAKADTRKTEDVTPSAPVFNTGCTEYSELFNEFAYRLKSAIDGGLYRASLSEEEEKNLLESIAQHMTKFRCIPTESQDRDVRTDRTLSASHLLTSSWEKQTDTKKKRVVAQEVCLLFGLDSESNHDTSRTLMGLWKN
jgi:hypothetical protein